jgi:hypothetical protein
VKDSRFERCKEEAFKRMIQQSDFVSIIAEEMVVPQKLGKATVRHMYWDL